MSLSDLVNHATNKERFHTVEQYIDFCARPGSPHGRCAIKPRSAGDFHVS